MILNVVLVEIPLLILLVLLLHCILILEYRNVLGEPSDRG